MEDGVQKHDYIEGAVQVGRSWLHVRECEPGGQGYMRKVKGGWFTVHVDNRGVWRPAPPLDMQTPYYEGLEAAQLAAEEELLSNAREIVRVFEAAEPAGDPAKMSADICGND